MKYTNIKCSKCNNDTFTESQTVRFAKNDFDMISKWKVTMLLNRPCLKQYFCILCGTELKLNELNGYLEEY